MLNLNKKIWIQQIFNNDNNNIDNINDIIYPNISYINNVKEKYKNNNNDDVEKKNQHEKISNITNFNSNSNNNKLILENGPMKIQIDSIRKKELEIFISKIGEKI